MKTKIKSSKDGRFRKNGKKLFWAEIPWEVVRDKRLTETAKWVLAYTRFAQNENKNAWPSVSKIASMIGKKNRQVERAIRLLQETGWLERGYRKGPSGVSTSAVPLSSDWKKNGVYEVEDILSFVLNTEDTMSSGSVLEDTIPRQDSVLEDGKIVSCKTPDSVLEDTLKEKEKIIKKKTTTTEEVFNCEETEKEETEREELTRFLQAEYQAVLGIAYAPTKGDKAILTELSKYPISQVEEFISQALKDRKAGKLSFFKIGVVLNRLQKTGITEQPKSQYKLYEYGSNVETLYRHIKTGKVVTFNELPEEEQENWRE